MSDIAIKVENLSKRYRIGLEEELPDTFVGAAKKFLTSPLRNFRQLRALSRFEGGNQTGDGHKTGDGRRETGNSVPSPQSSVTPSDVIWALKDVSFEVERGEVVGIIGPNGAGKSTLLKILSRITHPTSGRVELNGRVSSLLEVGTGFHQELTGRENIYLNGTILGMTKAEVDRKFDEIVAFSGVEKFIDTPVKRYSSGMRVRLAFSVAAHLEPEILLIDEVLAVGDVAFQKKCLGKMGDVALEGRTVLFVSHNMAAVENLCERAMLLDAGHIVHLDKTQSAIRVYLERVVSNLISVPLAEREDRSGNGVIRLDRFYIEDGNGKKVRSIQSGKDAVLIFSFSCSNPDVVRNVSVGFGIHSYTGQRLAVLYSDYVGEKIDFVPARGEFRCHISRFPFAPGSYQIHARVVVNREESDWLRNPVAYIDVEAGDFFGTGNKGDTKAPFLLQGSWSVNECHD